ncbi:MAG TPA: SIR2 family protein [Desulfatiglandales bacterium]|nr:SIR2 family protein [Desulfatiglandales bacterium]
MTVNDKISKSGIFLFLGAGASSPFGGWLMSEFIANVMSQLHTNRDLYDLLGTLAHYADYDLEGILKELGDICNKRYFADKSRINYINNFLDSELEQEERNKEREKTKAQGIGGGYVGSVKEISGFSKRYGELVKKCKELRTDIEIQIFEHYGNLDNSLVVETYKPVFDILLGSLNEDKILPIFMTNYDRIIEYYRESENEKVCMIDGFGEMVPDSGERIWNRNVFDNFQAEQGKPNIVLFKLHGSIYWYEKNKRIVYAPIAIQRGPKERIKNVLIYPAMYKIATNEPFFTGYDYFQRCLDNAELGIFIGYSFRDYDTVTKIRSSLNFNSKLTLIILDPNAEKLVADNFAGFKNRFMSLKYSFGRKTDIDNYLEQIKKALEK